MTSKTITLASADYFHARPAAQIAAAAKPFKSVVMVTLGTGVADAKDALSLMRLGHPGGTPVELFADGPDEQEALKAVLEAVGKAFTLQYA